MPADTGPYRPIPVDTLSLMTSPSELGTRVVERALALGFARAGIATPEPSRWAAQLRQWLEAGRHGSMGYLAEHLDVRLDPGALLEGTRSIVMVADLYAQRGSAEDGALADGHGRVARYARGRDYHKVIKKRLHELCDALRAEHPEAGFRAFVDTAPVLERELAERAGMGWIGKHTLLIDSDIGSYVLLGGIATTLLLEPPPAQRSISDHCGSCTRCIDACPTDAITPHSVDARACISYLTIERRGPIDEGLHEPIGDWLYGCDVCQEVCPHNSPRPRAAGALALEAYRSTRDSFDLLEVLGWDESARRAAFEGSAMKRATLAMMKRNALIVGANRLPDDEAFAARVREIAEDAGEDPLVRATAQQVLRRRGSA